MLQAIEALPKTIILAVTGLTITVTGWAVNKVDVLVNEKVFDNKVQIAKVDEKVDSINNKVDEMGRILIRIEEGVKYLPTKEYVEDKIKEHEDRDNKKFEKVK